MGVSFDVSSHTLGWAVRRSGKSLEEIRGTFRGLDAALVGGARLSLSMLRRLAKVLHTNIGFLVLPTPPEEILRIPDLRPSGGHGERSHSVNLLDTVYLCSQRQLWWRERVSAIDEPEPDLIGALRAEMDIQQAADWVRTELDIAAAQRQRNPVTMFRMIADRVESLGVMAMVSGVFGSSNRRCYDLAEFRCLIMNDEVAPLLYINGRDSKAAQIYSLVHAFVHICLGDSGIDRVDIYHVAEGPRERWCHLVTLNALIRPADLTMFDAEEELVSELRKWAVRLTITPLAIARQGLELGLIEMAHFEEAYEVLSAEAEAKSREAKEPGGGDFYIAHRARVGKRFARAIYADVSRGGTLYREAYQLLIVSGYRTFARFREVLQ